MWSYNHEIEPPAPFLDITIIHPQDPTNRQTIPAKLDTGADVSAIPQLVARWLSLIPARTILVEGYDGAQSAIDTYIVVIEIAKARFRNAEVILIPDNHALLGRDLLNFLYIDLNGPDLTFDIKVSA